MPSAIQRLHVDAVEPGSSWPHLADDEVHLWLEQLAPPASAREVSAFGRQRLGQLLRHYSGIDATPDLMHNEHGKPQPGIAATLSAPAANMALGREQPLVDASPSRKAASAPESPAAPVATPPAKPVEVKQVETKPVETKPVETKPVEEPKKDDKKT